jgi:hypothetical protein
MSSGALFVEPIVIATGGALTTTSAGAGDDPAAYSPVATYAQNDRATVGESVFQSVQDANTGHTVIDTAWWVRVGAINKMRMFDQRVGAQTENPESIVVEITPHTIVDVISLKNLSALSVRVVQQTPVEGFVYDRTIALDAPVVDWYEYFFSDIAMQTEVIFPDVKPYGDAVFGITIDAGATGTARCGELLMGAALDAGITEAGVQTGIDDYSLIAPDEFGVRDIVERDFAENMDLTLYVKAGRSSTLTRLLTKNRARPILLVASDARPDAQVYGLAESWRRTLSYPDMDVFTVTMRGLT